MENYPLYKCSLCDTEDINEVEMLDHVFTEHLTELANNAEVLKKIVELGILKVS